MARIKNEYDGFGMKLEVQLESDETHAQHPLEYFHCTGFESPPTFNKHLSLECMVSFYEVHPLDKYQKLKGELNAEKLGKMDLQVKG